MNLASLSLSTLVTLDFIALEAIIFTQQTQFLRMRHARRDHKRRYIPSELTSPTFSVSVSVAAEGGDYPNPGPDVNATHQNERNGYDHADIDWVLRPWMEANPSEEDQVRLMPNAIPFLEFPVRADGKVVLESWLKVHGQKNSEEKKKVGRFGITVMAGPTHPVIFETIQQLCDENLSPPYGAAAIIYMFVEEEYRKRGIGELALEAIGLIHSKVGCGYTVLVADDDGSGKLVSWYEQHGFFQAPLLQDLLGSPDGVFGVAMIAPAARVEPSESFSLTQQA